jgi:hypothetical protein
LSWPGDRDLRITWPARSLAEYSRDAGYVPLCRAIARTDSLRLCTLGKIKDELEARLRFLGRANLRAAHGKLSGELNHADDERRGRALLRAAGFVVPSRPLPVRLGDTILAEVDIPFFDILYGVEIDGPPHLLAEVAAKDRARDRRLGRELRWQIDRFLWFEIDEDPEGFVREVAARVHALRARAS